jgi:hemolysin activation/secretion protein
VALRAGGALASGSFPVQHAATLGGSSTLRGYAWQRFTGETSAYGSTELRVPTGSVNLLVRWQVGMFALADIGRVWYDTQSDGGWHTGFGGGLWLSSLGKGLSLAYARGEEHRLYLGTGASF